MSCAGNVPAASDFICKVPCGWGPQAMANAVQGPRRQLAEGIYVPPYTINNANNQVLLWIADATRRLLRLINATVHTRYKL
jgi:hypothetical protein